MESKGAKGSMESMDSMDSMESAESVDSMESKESKESIDSMESNESMESDMESKMQCWCNKTACARRGRKFLADMGPKYRKIWEEISDVTTSNGVFRTPNEVLAQLWPTPGSSQVLAHANTWPQPLFAQLF